MYDQEVVRAWSRCLPQNRDSDANSRQKPRLRGTLDCVSAPLFMTTAYELLQITSANVTQSPNGIFLKSHKLDFWDKNRVHRCTENPGYTYVINPHFTSAVMSWRLAFAIKLRSLKLCALHHIIINIIIIIIIIRFLSHLQYSVVIIMCVHLRRNITRNVCVC